MELGMNSQQENNKSKENDAIQKKRKSKDNPESRVHKCEVCGKTYLSKPTVTQHMKSKHPELDGGIKRGRGRPRKDESKDFQNNSREMFMKSFFDKSSRVKGLDSYDIEHELSVSFQALQNDFNDVLFKSLEEEDILDYPLSKLNKDEEEDTALPITFDQAIIKYLRYAGTKSSKSFFQSICKFSIIFREYINQSKLKLDGLKHPFSKYNTSEFIPESCNDFIVEFLEENSFFNLEINEVVEEIQHFCTWLFENGFTNSMLSLVSG